MSSAKNEVRGLDTDVAGLAAHAGTHLGYSGWRTMTQDEVDRFADLTNDHNWIHVDRERAGSGPFGGTIAHGYLTLSLLAPLMLELVNVRGASTVINYGLNRLRFPAPLPVGARYRAGLELAKVEEVAGGVQAQLNASVEVEGVDKPSLVAECLVRYYA
jgi:acyl dehydratase